MLQQEVPAPVSGFGSAHVNSVLHRCKTQAAHAQVADRGAAGRRALDLRVQPLRLQGPRRACTGSLCLMNITRSYDIYIYICMYVCMYIFYNVVNYSRIYHSLLRCRIRRTSGASASTAVAASSPSGDPQFPSVPSLFASKGPDRRSPKSHKIVASTYRNGVVQLRGLDSFRFAESLAPFRKVVQVCAPVRCFKW